MTPSPDYTPPAVTERDGGVYVRVRAAPGSRCEGILGVRGDALRVAVRAPPERGKANAALVEALARALGLHPRSVAVARGEASRDKLLWIEGLSRAEFIEKLGNLLPGARKEQ